MKLKKINILAFLTLLLLSLPVFSSDFVVIVNKASASEKLSPKELSKIFLGEQTTWPDGSQIKLAALKEGDIHGEFTREILKMTPMQFSVHWKQKLYTGSLTGTDVTFIKTDDKIKEYVAKNPGAIGYISASALDDSVKKIDISRD